MYSTSIRSILRRKSKGREGEREKGEEEGRTRQEEGGREGVGE